MTDVFASEMSSAPTFAAPPPKKAPKPKPEDDILGLFAESVVESKEIPKKESVPAQKAEFDILGMYKEEPAPNVSNAGKGPAPQTDPFDIFNNLSAPSPNVRTDAQIGGMGTKPASGGSMGGMGGGSMGMSGASTGMGGGSMRLGTTSMSGPMGMGGGSTVTSGSTPPTNQPPKPRVSEP